jgi:hypothetical protein
MISMPGFLYRLLSSRKQANLLVSENEYYRQEINADQRHGCFSSVSAGFRPQQTNTVKRPKFGNGP